MVEKLLFIVGILLLFSIGSSRIVFDPLPPKVSWESNLLDMESVFVPENYTKEQLEALINLYNIIL